MSINENETHTTTTTVGANNEVTTIRSNKYIHKKTLAQGMFDVALLSSNTNQLVQLVEINRRNELVDDKYITSPFFILAIVLLSISITIQVIVGVCLLAIGLLDHDKSDVAKKTLSKRLNNITTILIFLITVISIVIPSFTSGLIPSDKAKIKLC